MDAKQTPLIDLLECVPADARMVYEHDQFHSQNIPVGRLCHEAAAALRTALEQPELEPVATVAMCVSGAHLCWDGKYLGQRPDMKIAMLLKDLPVGTLLFTHQPRREWRGLTDADFDLICDNHSTLQGAARAIEAALKEKNL